MSNTITSIRIATRNSPLALWQAYFVRDLLESRHPEITVEILGMSTKGDQILDRSLSKVGGKGLFMKELEEALLDGRADIAVHSMKDVTIDLPAGLEICCVFDRETPNDAFVSNSYQSLSDLPAGSVVGTSSLRRRAQLKHFYPNLQIKDLRGNVNTRLKKLDDGEYSAIILAAAGLKRLGFDERITSLLSDEESLPAVGQGIVGIECRDDDAPLKELLRSLNSHESEVCITAERSMNRVLDGGCSVPIAGFAQLVGDQLTLRGRVGDIETGKMLKAEGVMDKSRADELGKVVAQDLLEQGAATLLQKATDAN